MSIEDLFPNLKTTSYSITSPATIDYNCIAWAAGVIDDWWWPDPLEVSTWPKGIPREETVSAFIAAFQTVGFVPGANECVEEGFEKVALYALNGFPKHAARQLPNGRWTSKLGSLEDIEHTLEALDGDWYGTAVQILKRQITP